MEDAVDGLEKVRETVATVHEMGQRCEMACLPLLLSRTLGFSGDGF